MKLILQKHTSIIFTIYVFISQTYQTVELFFNEYCSFDIFFHVILFQQKCKQDVVLSITTIFKNKICNKVIKTKKRTATRKIG